VQITDLISLLEGKHWLALIMLCILVVRKWTGPDSKFPITIPAPWQPTVTAAGGLVYGLVGALQAGSTPGQAVLAMAIAAGAGGFLDGLLVAIFDHDNAPVWARSIVFIFDDLTGGTSTKAAGERVKRNSSRPPPAPPIVSKRELLNFVPNSLKYGVSAFALGATVAVCFILSAHCKGPGVPSWQQVENVVLSDLEANDGITQIETDVEALFPPSVGTLIIDTIVNNAIALILSIPNLLPAQNVGNAYALQGQLVTKIAMLKAGK
jgi:hypothetical protein